jgi:DNA-binding transcriptional ArsR family regulator
MLERPMSDIQQQISTETALRLLAKQQRRQILRRMAETSGGTSVEELAIHLGETDSTRSNGGELLDSNAVQLHHVHLPMLADAGVLTYDTTQGVVGRGHAFQTVVSLLEVIDTHRENTSMGQS